MKQIILIALVLIIASVSNAATNPFNSDNDVTAFFNQNLNTTLNYSCITGYIPIDWYFPNSNSSLFYQMVTMQGQIWPNVPHTTPILFWFNGGPGSSSQIGSWEQFGPFAARNVNPPGQFGNATFYLRQISWNSEAMIVFIDQPLNVGWSYSNEPGLKIYNSTVAGQHLANFAYNFYQRYPQLMSNPLYLTGESYGGHYVPCFAYTLLNNANLTDLFTTIPFKEVFRGIAVGDGLTNMEYQEQYFDTFYYSIGLASEQMRQTLYQREINGQNIFQSYPLDGNSAYLNFWNTGEPSDNDFGGVDIYNFNNYPTPPMISVELFQNAQFKQGYGIPEGVNFGGNNGGSAYMGETFRQDESEPYDAYYNFLLERNYQVLIYQGQNDIIINQPAAVRWVNELDWINLPFWQQAKQVVYQMPNAEGKSVTVGTYQSVLNFCFATIYNAGHLVPTDQPAVALNMITKYLSWNFVPTQEEIQRTNERRKKLNEKKNKKNY